MVWDREVPNRYSVLVAISMVRTEVQLVEVQGALKLDPSKFRQGRRIGRDSTNFLAAVKFDSNFQSIIFNSLYRRVAWTLVVGLLPGQCHRTSMMRTQYQFRITSASLRPIMCAHWDKHFTDNIFQCTSVQTFEFQIKFIWYMFLGLIDSTSTLVPVIIDTNFAPNTRQAIKCDLMMTQFTNIYRDNYVHAPSQWKPALQCNAISHWLGAYTEWSLPIYAPPGLNKTGIVIIY